MLWTSWYVRLIRSAAVLCVDALTTKVSGDSKTIPTAPSSRRASSRHPEKRAPPTMPILTFTHLRNQLNHPPLPLRSLDPAGHPPAPRRKPAARKPSAALSTMGPPELPASAATPSTSSDVPKAKTTTKGKQRVHPAADATDGAAQPPPAKRRRASQKELKRPAVIACQTCGNTDVPLLLGGRTF